jgi:excisionase family DNA binding protein
MAGLSLKEAAEQVGVSKSTIWRAINSGRLSAPRDDDGNFHIQPSELFRAYPPKGENDGAPTRSGHGSADRDASSPDATELRVRNAALEAQLAGMKDMVEELRRARDQWQAQAERATLALQKPEPPAVIPMPAPQPVASEVSARSGENLGATVGKSHTAPDGPVLTIRLPRWLRRRSA